MTSHSNLENSLSLPFFLRWSTRGWLSFSPAPFETPESLIYPDSTREKLKTLAEQFRDGRESFEALKLPWRRGILFAGGPGQGKSAATRAIASYLGSTTLHITLPAHEVLNAGGWDWACAQILQKIEERQALDPSVRAVVVLDQFDEFTRRMEPQDFFQILDHAWARSQGTLWIATTRHPDLVPKTQAIRPGRFEQMFRFDGPNLETREKLLRNLPLGVSDEYTFRELLDLTESLHFAHFEEMRQICAHLLLEQREMELISAMRVYLQDQLLTSDRSGGYSDVTLNLMQRVHEVDPRVLKSALGLTDIFTALMEKTLADAFEKANETGVESHAQH